MDKGLLFCLFISLVCLCSLLPLSSGHRLVRGRPFGNKHGMLGLPVSNVSYYASSLPPAQWYNQRLDHFDPVNTKTWKQRYFVDFKYVDNDRNNAPVFLQLGGEGEANPIWLVQGQVATNYAKHFKAAQVLLEHRYYGKSHPTEDMSTKNLQYLTSEQALQDAASFIQYFKQKYGMPNSKWIVFGGSYSGSLSAWFRLKYPHLAAGAIASSAPVQAVMNFDTYLKVVDTSLGPKCVGEIRSAVDELSHLLKTQDGWQQIGKQFQLCDPLDGNNQKDVYNLMSSLAGNFEGVVQYNKDNRKFEGAAATNITIDVICSTMTNVADSSAVNRFAQVNSILLNAYGLKCLDYKYDHFVKSLSEVSFNKSKDTGARLWTYQTCTEFGFFQSSDYPNQPFGNYFPNDFFVQQCVDIYGPKFNKQFIERSIEFTNNFYGGYNLTLSNVHFINGLIDPWHALGILREINPTARPLVIAETAHCADLYPDSDLDPQSLKDARDKIKMTIGQFLHN